MSSPHLLRPYSARQLNLIAGEGRVIVFAVLGGHFRGPSVEVHVPTLLQRVNSLPPEIDLVVFIDEFVPDAGTISLIDDMVDACLEEDAEVLAQFAPVTEAVKRVAGGRIVEGVDRNTLAAIRTPEVIRRTALERALSAIGERQWINPTSLVAQTGGRVRVVPPGALLEKKP
jgi:2-C-methyl-D-erythritol 4-phosphate cytidylyltransferase